MLIKTARLSLLLATSMGQELLTYSFLPKKIQVYNVIKIFFKELQSVVPESCEYLKAFTTVNKINDKLQFHYCVETVNVPDKFSKCNLDKLKLYELTNEDKWLTSFYDDVSETTSWTSYHEKQSRDKTSNILTINVPLPLIYLQIKFCRSAVPLDESGS